MHPAHARAIMSIAERMRALAPVYLSREMLLLADEAEQIAYSRLEPNVFGS